MPDLLPSLPRVLEEDANVSDELRGAGIATGGPPALHARDRQAFANALDRWLAQRRP